MKAEAEGICIKLVCMSGSGGPPSSDWSSGVFCVMLKESSMPPNFTFFFAPAALLSRTSWVAWSLNVFDFYLVILLEPGFVDGSILWISSR